MPQFITFTQQFNAQYPGWEKRRLLYPTNGDAVNWAKKAKEAGTFPNPHPDDPYGVYEEQK